MGCKAITPHLVSLAKRLEGKPFHLVASHCQRDSQENVVAYLESKGLEPSTPNFTAVSFGNHPKVKGNGYVPYYAVFDHTGKLIYHHMCGAYHGGDGLRMIEWVDDLLKKTPAVYLGEPSFQHVAELMDDLQTGKKLAAQVAKLEKRLDGDAEEASVQAELEQLYQRLEAWRDRELNMVLARVGSRPSMVLPELGNLAKQLKRTRLVEPLESQLEELEASKDHKQAVALEKIWTTARGKIDKLRQRDNSEKSVGKRLDALEAELVGWEHLPIAGAIRGFVVSMRG